MMRPRPDESLRLVCYEEGVRFITGDFLIFHVNSLVCKLCLPADGCDV